MQTNKQYYLSNLGITSWVTRPTKLIIILSEDLTNLTKSFLDDILKFLFLNRNQVRIIKNQSEISLVNLTSLNPETILVFGKIDINPNKHSQHLDFNQVTNEQSDEICAREITDKNSFANNIKVLNFNSLNKIIKQAELKKHLYFALMEAIFF